jgi:hypothetical protein
VSLAKKEIDLDSLSLEGLEGLLDQIFGPSQGEPVGDDGLAAGPESDSCLSASETAHGEPAARPCATLPDTRVSRHNRLRELGHPKQVQVLANQIKILRARLHFALEQLEQARLTEASLRLSLAHVQDQFKELADKSESAAV